MTTEMGSLVPGGRLGGRSTVAWPVDGAAAITARSAAWSRAEVVGGAKAVGSCEGGVIRIPTERFSGLVGAVGMSQNGYYRHIWPRIQPGRPGIRVNA